MNHCGDFPTRWHGLAPRNLFLGNTWSGQNHRTLRVLFLQIFRECDCRPRSRAPMDSMGSDRYPGPGKKESFRVLLPGTPGCSGFAC